MSDLHKYVTVLFWASLPMIFGLLLFTNGFFLRRSSILQHSNCSRLENNLVSTSISSECFPTHFRVVLLIVDALKYEFVEKFVDEASFATYHRNKIPVVAETLKKYPKNSRLFKFLADPPTTTMQRLKSLTTGTLPTFIDIQDNFAADAIMEDNLIVQNKKQGNIIIGDDTWINLYPDMFLRDFTAPSFQVSDLDTVDHKVRKHIFKELDKKDWSLLIGHTLGVDHCGHKHGMHHPEMTRKLNETNILIKDLVDKINEEKTETILMVVGDHGMTESGDHGGDTEDEMESAMFIYSTKHLIDTQMQLNIETKLTVNQIDMVPTIAVILGIPIPFSNIGNLIMEALPSMTKMDDENWSDFDFILHSLHRNIFQIQYYINTYSAENFIADENELTLIGEMYNELNEKIKVVKTRSDLKKVVNLAKNYFNKVQRTCYELWVQFDSGLMSNGLLLFSCVIFFFFLILNGIPKEGMSKVFHSCILRTIVIGTLTVVSSVLLGRSFGMIENFSNITLFASGVVPMLSFVFLIIQNWETMTTTWYSARQEKKTVLNVLTRIVLSIIVMGAFSNSCIIEEDKILSFFLITLLGFLVYELKTKILEKKGKTLAKSDKKILILSLCPLAICLMIRLTSNFWRLREEQRTKKNDDILEHSNFVIGKAGSIALRSTETFFLMAAIFSLAVYIIVMKSWLRNCGNLSGYSPSVILARFTPEIMVVGISSFWILKIQRESKAIALLAHQINSIPLMVYALLMVALCVLYFWPLTVYIMPKQKETLKISEDENAIPKLYQKFKTNLYKKNENDQELPVAYGLGTVYSSCYMLVTLFLCLTFTLLLGYVIAPSVILMNLVCMGLLFISSAIRIRTSTKFDQLLAVSDPTLVCWFLIAEYFFYATGHQPSFSTIHWDAAFIGFDSTLQMNVIRSILIGINTFGSYIILGIMLPLLVIAPFSLRLMFPLMMRSSAPEDEKKRGELLLFERNKEFHAELFSVSGKYIIFHGFRVLACMFAATIHCRHLMVWKIFAPKLIFEGISFFITVTSVLVSNLLILRIENRMERMISKLSSAR